MRNHHYQQKVVQTSSENLRSVLLECSSTATPLFDNINWFLEHKDLHNSILWGLPVMKKACRDLKRILTSDQTLLVLPYDPASAHAIAYMTSWFHKDYRSNPYYSRYYVRHERFHNLTNLGAYIYDEFLNESWRSWPACPGGGRVEPSLTNSALVMIEAENADDDLLIELLKHALRLKSLPEIETLRIVLFK